MLSIGPVDKRPKRLYFKFGGGIIRAVDTLIAKWIGYIMTHPGVFDQKIFRGLNHLCAHWRLTWVWSGLIYLAATSISASCLPATLL